MLNEFFCILESFQQFVIAVALGREISRQIVFRIAIAIRAGDPDFLGAQALA
jgi:hypothetical protein